ncbi:MAG: hypothetical protein EA392_10685 [Cryomorphaceae bacterium]|nr:MAG: hypothetical protein EA392_10685 [Cryomorphaceae bacterium]
MSDFEQHLRNQLSQYESPVDTGAVWAGVQQKMASGVKGGFALSWYMGALLVLLIAGGIGWGLHAAQNHATALYEPRNTEALAWLNVDDFEAESSIATLPGELENELIASAEHTHASAQPASTRIETTNHHTDHAEPQPEKRLNTLPYTPGDDAETVGGSKPMINPESEYATGRATKQTSAESGEAKTSDLSSKASSAPSAPSAPTQTSAYSRLNTMPTRWATAFGLSTREPSLMGGPWEMPEWEHPDKEPEPTGKWMLRGGIGAGLPVRQLSAQESAMESYTERRNQTETPLDFMSAHLMVGMRLSGGWYAMTGLNITQITESFHLRMRTEESTTVPVISEIFINANGDSLLTYQDAEATIVRETEMNHYNRYTLIDVPLFVGHEWQRGRWFVALEGGVMFNLSLRASGSVLAYDEVPVRLENSGMIRSRVNFSYAAQLRLGYQWSPRWRAEIAASYRAIPGSMLSDDAQKQNYHLPGLQLGLRYQIFNR